jgi:hypothetical protein
MLRSLEPFRGSDSDLLMRGERTGGGALGRLLLPARLFWALLTAVAAIVAALAASATAAAACMKSAASTSAAAGVANSGDCITGHTAEGFTEEQEGLYEMVAVACDGGTLAADVSSQVLSNSLVASYSDEARPIAAFRAWLTRHAGSAGLRTAWGICVSKSEGGGTAVVAPRQACRLAIVRVLIPVGVAWKSQSSPTAGRGSGGWCHGGKSVALEPVHSCSCGALLVWGSALIALRLAGGSPAALHDETAATGSDSAL